MARVRQRTRTTLAIEDTRPGATISREGSSVTSRRAKQVAPVLRRLEKDNRVLRPADVVKEARDPASPLHPLFEWDDSRAAHQHRLATARMIIKTVHYRVQLEGPSSTLMKDSIPAFQHYRTVTPEGKKDSFYISHHSKVISREEMRRTQIERAIEQLNEWKKKFNTVLALSKGAAGIADQLLEQLVGLKGL